MTLDSEADFYVVQISIPVASRLLLTLGLNSISPLQSDFRYATGKAAFISRRGHPNRGREGRPHYHVTSIDLKV